MVPLLEPAITAVISKALSTCDHRAGALLWPGDWAPSSFVGGRPCGSLWTCDGGGHVGNGGYEKGPGHIIASEEVSSNQTDAKPGC